MSVRRVAVRLRRVAVWSVIMGRGIVTVRAAAACETARRRRFGKRGEEHEEPAGHRHSLEFFGPVLGAQEREVATTNMPGSATWNSGQNVPTFLPPRSHAHRPPRMAACLEK